MTAAVWRDALLDKKEKEDEKKKDKEKTRKEKKMTKKTKQVIHNQHFRADESCSLRDALLGG